jgi:glutamine synthetase
LLDDCPELTEAMGEEFTMIYKAIKRMEYDEFQEVISPWEREHLLMNV